ncbi:MAG: PQQ-dependent sugar dehydrogenase [Pseudomonadota bacterium]|nr:PQQ-dependent sugar dehydrogenase [Pseudomonadota bacterium]
MSFFKFKYNLLITVFCYLISLNFLFAKEFDYKIEEIEGEFNYPWSSVFLPNGDFLITEMPGKIKLINGESKEVTDIKGVPNVLFRGQGGLSDIILHPNYEENKKIYLSFSYGDKRNNTLRVISAQLENDQLSNQKLIFDATPYRKTSNHYGARLLFLNDNSLIITSGDGFNYRELAQELDNHYGKIIRVMDDGSIPGDNPFLEKKNALPEIWTYGHRNQQGLALDKVNNILYSHEHGPRGGDEINIIEPGKNYGWPAITYGIDYNGSIISPFTEKEGLEQPLKYWVPSIGPLDMVFYDGEVFPELKGNLLICSAVPGDIRKISLDGSNVREDIIFKEIKGRVRSIKSSSKGNLLILTDGPKGKAYIISR